MPFTGSHPAAVLPFLGTPLPTSALVIGSMSPDLPYFIRALGLQHSDTHSLSGILGLDLVLGFTLWVVWHGLLAAPALAGAPAAVRARCAGVRVGLWGRLRAGHLLAVLAGLGVGASTHVVWDLFTHPYSWGAEQVPALSRTYGGVAGWTWAQVVCSALGMLALLVYLALWWRRAVTVPAGPPARRGGGWVLHPAALVSWYALAIAACAGAIVGALAFAETDLGLRALPFLVLTRAGTLAGVVALAVALGWHAFRRTGRAPGAEPAG